MNPNILEHHLVSRLKFKYLQLLVTVGEQRNIFKAAQIHNMAQPAATKIIRDIESALNIELFDRSSRGVTPTLYGEVLIKHAKLILSQVKHASEELSSLHGGLSGRVTVGSLLAASATLLPNAINRLKKNRPNVSVSLMEGTGDKLLNALKIDDLDIMVGRIPEVPDEDGLTNEILYHEPVVIVTRADHPLQGKKNLALADLVDQQWILPPRETMLRKEIDMAFHRDGLDVPVNPIESVSILTNRTLLKNSDMITALPLQVVLTYEEIGLLKRLDMPLIIEPGPIGVTLRAHRQLPPAADYLLDSLREEAAKLTARYKDLY
ncbi:LysR substrate-binding domain-containing protein [Thalassotalea crassostreae]|uniref:LysR substrate-binding domain-containing protein n=1 Tax=Thalassotalea crassostreae TaxID=1763536 RepID=UPI000838B5CD|nr:LysR substrate-binding domain-containing protein [Thalassotalea crassostreae]